MLYDARPLFAITLVLYHITSCDVMMLGTMASHDPCNLLVNFCALYLKFTTMDTG